MVLETSFLVRGQNVLTGGGGVLGAPEHFKNPGYGPVGNLQVSHYRKKMFFGADSGLDFKCPLALSNYILLLQSDKQGASSSVVQVAYENLVKSVKKKSGFSLIPAIIIT